jgi:hypothetical protein
MGNRPAAAQMAESERIVAVHQNARAVPVHQHCRKLAIFLKIDAQSLDIAVLPAPWPPSSRWPQF